MKSGIARSIILVSLAIQLGGCTSLFELNLAHRGDASQASSPTGPERRGASAQSATEDGRGQLTDGRIASAIGSFEVALAIGEPVGPAANGLGVAYVRLGRLDIARRYFEQAIAAEPSSQRYASNLQRLERDEMLLAAAESIKSAQMPAPIKAASVEEVKPGMIQRLSRGEVMIRTMDQPTAERNSVQMAAAIGTATPVNHALQRVSRGEVAIRTVSNAPARAFAKVGGDFQPVIRISFVELADKK